MAVEDNKRVVRRVLDEVANGHNLAALDDLYSAAPAREHVREDTQMLHAAFPDLRFTQEDLIGEGEMVAMRFTGSGTQTGPLQGRPPTGEHVTWHGLVLSRVVDGRIVGEWHALDPSDFMRMLGMPNRPPPK